MEMFFNTLYVVSAVALISFGMIFIVNLVGKFSKVNQQIELGDIVNRNLTVKDTSTFEPYHMSSIVEQWMWVPLKLKRKKLLIEAGVKPEDALLPEITVLDDTQLKVLAHLKKVS